MHLFEDKCEIIVHVVHEHGINYKGWMTKSRKSGGYSTGGGFQAHYAAGWQMTLICDLQTHRVRKKSCFSMVAIDRWERRGRRWETAKTCQESRDLGEFEPRSVLVVDATGPLTTNTSLSHLPAGWNGGNNADDTHTPEISCGMNKAEQQRLQTMENQIPMLFHFVPPSLFSAWSPLPGPHLDPISMDLR